MSSQTGQKMSLGSSFSFSTSDKNYMSEIMPIYERRFFNFKIENLSF